MMVDESDNTIIYPSSWKWVSCLVAIVNFIAFFCCLFFLISLLTSKKGIIYDGYNIFIFFLIVPDTFNTFMRGVQESVVTAKEGRNFPPYFINVIMGTWFFYFTSNLYINAILTYEINMLIRRSYRRVKTSPPKVRRVLIQVTCVYAFALSIAIWVALDLPWSPIHVSNSQKGTYNLGSFKDEENDSVLISGKASYFISFSIVMIPIIYVITIRILIWKNKLLPKSGRTRVLSLFFMRIIIVFLLFYLPNALITPFLTEERSMEFYFWGRKITGILTSLQALLTLYMASYKEDILQVLTANIKNSIIISKSIFHGRNLSIITGGNYSNGIILHENNNKIENDSNRQRKSQWDEEDVYDGDPITVESLEEGKNSTTANSLSNQQTSKVSDNNDDIIDNRESRMRGAGMEMMMMKSFYGLQREESSQDLSSTSD